MANLEKYLKSINPLDIKYKGTNLTYRQILQKESNRLKNLIQKNIEDYYNSYPPVLYKRGNHGGNLHNTLSIDDACDISVNGMTITIKVNDNAIHDSINGDHDSNAFWLMNDGWSVKEDVWFKDIEHFGYFEGAHFVENAIEEFNKTNRYGIKVEVVKPQRYY